MSAPGQKKISPAKAIPYAVAALLLLAIAGGLVVPEILRLMDTQKKLNAAQEDLVVRETLFPFYAQIQGQDVPELEASLHRETTGPLAKNEISNLSTIFSGIAAEAGVELRATIPKSYTLDDGSQFLQVQITAAGSYEAFQPFMLAATRQPSFIHLLEAYVIKGELEEELHMIMWLSIE